MTPLYSLDYDFNPRTHEECDYTTVHIKVEQCFISIHALTRSATSLSCCIPYAGCNFNPRTHEECDLYAKPCGRRLFYFNPRTHEECDQTPKYRPSLDSYFNPRTHEECDKLLTLAARPAVGFQSTHSRGVRPPRVTRRNESTSISIHALTRSATHVIVFSPGGNTDFNPRTHEECDK